MENADMRRWLEQRAAADQFEKDDEEFEDSFSDDSSNQSNGTVTKIDALEDSVTQLKTGIDREHQDSKIRHQDVQQKLTKVSQLMEQTEYVLLETQALQEANAETAKNQIDQHFSKLMHLQNSTTCSKIFEKISEIQSSLCECFWHYQQKLVWVLANCWRYVANKKAYLVMVIFALAFWVAVGFCEFFDGFDWLLVSRTQERFEEILDVESSETFEEPALESTEEASSPDGSIPELTETADNKIKTEAVVTDENLNVLLQHVLQTQRLSLFHAEKVISLHLAALLFALYILYRFLTHHN